MQTTRADSQPSNLHGILLVDKPQGWTSHDVVAKTRGLTRQRKIGHTGTLDPMATGLLVLCLGDATRLVEYMADHDKHYSGIITLGMRTDTDDAEGTVIAEHPVPAVTSDTLQSLQRQFTGKLMQRPPAFSAVKVEGKRAYAVARAGGALELKLRPVTVHQLRLALVDERHLAINVHCGPGTYIRSLARDIGDVLGCGAHLSALRRTDVGWFSVNAASTLDGIANASAEGTITELLWQADEGVVDLAAAIVGAGSAELISHGSVIQTPPTGDAPGTSIRIYSVAGSFIGIGRLDANGELRPLKVLTNHP